MVLKKNRKTFLEQKGKSFWKHTGSKWRKHVGGKIGKQVLETFLGKTKYFPFFVWNHFSSQADSCIYAFFQLRRCRTVFVIIFVAQISNAQCMVCSVAEPEGNAYSCRADRYCSIHGLLFSRTVKHRVVEELPHAYTCSVAVCVKRC